MYNSRQQSGTTLSRNKSTVGETIEMKVARMVNQGEPITDGAPEIYTERKDGVMAGFDIRTDKWDVAIGAMDIVTKNKLAKREDNYKKRVEELDKLKGKNAEKADGEAESIQGTNENP